MFRVFRPIEGGGDRRAIQRRRFLIPQGIAQLEPALIVVELLERRLAPCSVNSLSGLG
jgi:hypothetical protein